MAYVVEVEVVDGRHNVVYRNPPAAPSPVPEEGPPWPAEALALLPVFRAMTSRDGWLRIMGWDQTSTWRCYGRAPADSGLMWCERSGWLSEFGGNPHHPVCPECGGIDVDRENDQ